MEKKDSLSVQQSRISNTEKELLSSYFVDNEPRLLALRNLLFGFTLSDTEKQQVEPLKQIKGLLRKIFLPELKSDVPIGQSVDLWMTVKFDGITDDNVIKARDLLIQRLEQALGRLEKLDNKIDLNVDKTVAGIMNRNTFITHIETQLMAIRAMANEKIENSVELALRKKKDSVK